MLKKNDEIRLTVKNCTVQGSGVCDYNGMTVFVRGGVTGDHIVAHIIKVKKTYAVGIIKKITQKSPLRIKAECPVCEKCGGCCFAQIDYKAELEIKAGQVRDNFHRIGKIDIEPQPIIASPSFTRYRNKAQYPVGSDSGFAQIGFYAPMTHRIIDCADCCLQPLEFKSIIDVFRNWIRNNKISIYNEQSHSGFLRHIYIRKGSLSGEIMVCLVTTTEEAECVEPLIHDLTSENANIKSIILNVNPDKTNVVLGKKCITLFGADSISDTLCGLKFKISPLSFYQVNHDAAELLYKKACEYADVKESDTLIDLYCGTGTIGLTMAKRAKTLIGVEIIPQAVENAKENAKQNGITNAEFICADAATFSCENKEADIVILDPPRKGCDSELLETVSKMSPNRIVYVSCDSATLARDCAIMENYGFKVIEVTPVDMFPRTGNVECVCLLKKVL